MTMKHHLPLLLLILLPPAKPHPQDGSTDLKINPTHYGFTSFSTTTPTFYATQTSHAHAQRVRRSIPIPISSTLHPERRRHVENFKLKLPSLGPHPLLLVLNEKLVPQEHFVRYQNDSQPLDELYRSPPVEDSEHCHYLGGIEGVKESWAAISTCDDQLRGVVWDGEEVHYLEPHPQQSKAVLHFRGRDALGFGNQNDSTQNHKRSKRGLRDHSDLRLPFASNSASRYVQLVMVVDHKKYVDLGSDLKATLRRTKDIVNIVNGMYSPFNIYISLVGVVVWSEQDEMTISKNGDTTLNSFLMYRRQRLLEKHPNDNAQLLTAVEFEDGVVGKAMQGPMCSFKYSGGVNSDFRNNPLGVIATTVAHELGHNFGLSHDSDKECHCPSGGRCIMAASSSHSNTSSPVWSDCSVKDMAYAFAHGMDYCLRDEPVALFDGPTCGNGFTEPGEECDCGLPHQCNNPCCDAANCLIHDNATCASGTCCDTNTCHYKEGGSVCRSPRGLCDLPEYCSGDSELCPADVTMLDGIECKTASGGDAFCASGQCRSHSDQCRLLWGPSGSNSDALCYARNSNGSRVAHCGYDILTERYSACATEDVSCGVAHCTMNTEKLEYGYESAAILASFFVNSGGKIYPCRSVVVDFGLESVSPGMTPDGASCGDGRMCLAQKCVAVKSVIGGKADGCGDCSTHGVCNSKGHCHCDEGFGGAMCEGGGAGGSIDSGPPTRSGWGSSRLLKALKVTLFGFIPLIAIITFYFYYANGSLKRLCMEIRAGGLAAVANPPLSSPAQNNNKPPPPQPRPPPPTMNGTVHSQSNGHAVTSPVGEDLFGAYKGFSLSPIKTQPAPAAPPAVVRKEEASHVTNVPRPNQMKHGVSWAQPIESRVPLSPPSEDDDSQGSETPLNLKPLPPEPQAVLPIQRPGLKKENSFSGLIGGVGSFLRNSLARASSSFKDVTQGNGSGGKSSGKKVEISQPILQGDVKVEGAVGINPLKAPQHRYANIPLADESGSGSCESSSPDTPPAVYANLPKPGLKSMQRVRETTPPPAAAQKQQKVKVQRAHSMISNSNRNSSGSNPNYNSLSRAAKRPSGPPPRPPSEPPPPPPNIQVKVPFFKSSTPPPYSSKASSPAVLRFNFGANSTVPSATGYKRGGSSIFSPPTKKEDQEDNIYDTIDEGRPQTPKLASSEESSPKSTTDDGVGLLLEKIDTISTNSSASENGGGLLSEIISEIKTRNRESIYNSVDRKKQKAKKKAEAAAAANAALEKERAYTSERRSSSPSIAPKSTTNNSYASERRSASPINKTATTYAAAKGYNYRGTTPPVNNYNKSVNPTNTYQRPSPPKSTTPPNTVPTTTSTTPNFKATTNNTKSNTYQKPSPPKSAITTTTTPNTTVTRPNGTYNRPSPPRTTNNTSAEATATPKSPTPKPTCAVNGIPQNQKGLPLLPQNANSNSYMAKINYFSNLSTTPPPMKPLSSLPAPSSTHPKEIIYAPSNVSGGSTGATIRRSRPATYVPSDGEPDEPHTTGAVAGTTPPSTTQGAFLKTPGGGGIYASLGRKVKGPRIQETTQISNPAVDGLAVKVEAIEPPKQALASESGSSGGGYKPFNPYLNRAPTFSTFRPKGGDTMGSGLAMSSPPPGVIKVNLK